MTRNYILEALRMEREARIPANWETYHSPLCHSLCSDDCPSLNYREQGIWKLWSEWKEIRDRQQQLFRQQNDIHQLTR